MGEAVMASFSAGPGGRLREHDCLSEMRLDLERQAGGRDPTERLPLAALSEDILGVTVGKVIIPVAAGRNLAVLVEAAVRNQILKLRGIDSMAEFLARQSGALQGPGDDGIE